MACLGQGCYRPNDVEDANTVIWDVNKGTSEENQLSNDGSDLITLWIVLLICISITLHDSEKSETGFTYKYIV